MKNLQFIVLIMLLAMVSSCASPLNYGNDYQAGINFSSFNSYAWHESNEFNELSNNYIANEIVDTRIRAHMDEQFQSKGFAKLSAQEDADFLVNYSIITQDRVDVDTYNVYSGYTAGWGYGGSYGYYGYPYRYYGRGAAGFVSGTETTVEQYVQGTLVIDVINASDNKLAWRGTVEGRMSQVQLNAQEREELITEVVAGILRDFPPEL